MRVYFRWVYLISLFYLSLLDSLILLIYFSQLYILTMQVHFSRTQNIWFALSAPFSWMRIIIYSNWNGWIRIFLGISNWALLVLENEYKSRYLVILEQNYPVTSIFIINFLITINLLFSKFVYPYVCQHILDPYKIMNYTDKF